MSVNKVNSLMGTFGGLNDWRVFGATPSWINPKNPPGFTSQSDSISLWITIKSILTMEYMVFSPNITWLTMSAVYLYFFPYGEVSFAYRLVVNTLLCGTYYFFFYAGLYLAGMSKRKFSPGSYPTTWNMIHNVYYWFLGVLQWTCYEYAMQKLWASDILSTPPTYGEILSDKHLMWLNCGTLLLIPIWRDFHFYSAHRFLHVRPLYRLVHSLHHRNTDPEPFSGLAMHPVEHLYYYSNALVPCIYLSGLSPLVFHFLLLHLTFAPAAGHSGFDDHFGSDQYHAIHHAKFEANYGSPSSAFLDRWFGTFRETLGKSSEYTGEWNEKQAEKEAAKGKKKVWSAHGHLGLHATASQAIYDFSMLALAALTVYSLKNGGFVEKDATMLGLAVAICPILVGALVNKVISKDKMSQLWPFQKEKTGLLYTAASAGAFCVLPIFHFVKWTAMIE